MRSNGRRAALACLVVALLFSALSRLAAQDEKLRVLVATGTAEQVRQALEKGANFNDRDWSGVTALMAAAASNHDPQVVLLLLRYGATVDSFDANGETALMFAAEQNADPRVISALLDGGARLEDYDRLGRTALVYAAKESAPVEVVARLLKAGANVNARDSWGLSPLAYAVWNATSSAVPKALLAAGADPNSLVRGRTLREYAQVNPALKDDVELLRALGPAAKAASAGSTAQPIADSNEPSKG